MAMQADSDGDAGGFRWRCRRIPMAMQADSDGDAGSEDSGVHVIAAAIGKLQQRRSAKHEPGGASGSLSTTPALLWCKALSWTLLQCRMPTLQWTNSSQKCNAGKWKAPQTLKQTAELQRLPNVGQAAVLIDVVKTTGLQMIAANPIGTILSRLIMDALCSSSIWSHQQIMFNFMSIGGALASCPLKKQFAHCTC